MMQITLHGKKASAATKEKPTKAVKPTASKNAALEKKNFHDFFMSLSNPFPDSSHLVGNEKWTCIACTIANADTLLVYEMCGLKRP